MCVVCVVYCVVLCNVHCAGIFVSGVCIVSVCVICVFVWFGNGLLCGAECCMFACVFCVYDCVCVSFLIKMSACGLRCIVWRRALCFAALCVPFCFGVRLCIQTVFVCVFVSSCVALCCELFEVYCLCECVFV